MLLCFALGEAMLILSLGFLIASIANSGVIGTIFIYLFYIYIIWTVGQFFGEKKWINYLKSGLACVFGIISYFVVLAFIAFC